MIKPKIHRRVLFRGSKASGQHKAGGISAGAGLWALLAALLFCAGCAAHAEKLAELKVGMKQPEVVKTLGKPEKVIKVRFQGHEDDYLVWQYQMMPDIPT